MSFLFLGIGLLIVSGILFHMAVKSQDKEGVIGMGAFIIASIFLIVIFGIFYNTLVK